MMKFFCTLFQLLDVIPYPYPSGSPKLDPYPYNPRLSGHYGEINSTVAVIVVLLFVVVIVCLGIIGLRIVKEKNMRNEVNGEIQDEENR